jgi:carboxypeptidase Taq
MAFHESQSRFWENVIGRSRPFWEGLFPLLRDFFPAQLAGVSIDRFYRAVNEVKPSFIRVDADELSYCLHIIFRFELEQRLISGDLDPRQVPAAWREKTMEYLGLDNEASGLGSEELALQDIHWSMGAFGYFPSYLLGNLYGLQLAQKMNKDIPDLEESVAAGNFRRLREWLGDTVYRWGCRLEPSELLRKITGEKLRVEPFAEYLETKYGAIYQVKREK